MNPLRALGNYRLSSGSFDAVAVQWFCSLGGVAVVPVAVLGVVRQHAGGSDLALGVGLAVLVGFLCVFLGMVSRRIGVSALTMTRRIEYAGDVACVGVLVAGVGGLACLDLTPVRVIQSVLFVCSLSLAVLVVGMTTTLVRSGQS